MQSLLPLLLTPLCCLTWTFPSAGADEISAAEVEEFLNEQVVPLLEARCYECHGPDSEASGGLLLTGRGAMLRGGDSGPALVPGKPDESLLIAAVRYESFEMPPRTRMPAAEVAILERWIAMGAPFPESASPSLPSRSEWSVEERKQQHWAWQPIASPNVPVSTPDHWARTDIDRFVYRKLQAAGLSPSPDADRRTLLRRLSFDLTGLPPSPDDLRSFATDPRSDDEVIAATVDRLLNSPHYGERWARHWLDLVRYAETLGHEFDYPLPHAWQYRDYVIRAINSDVPYDQFLAEHLAGDLLTDEPLRISELNNNLQRRFHPDRKFNESEIATGFWYLGEDKHAPVDVRAEELARIDNQLDVFSRAFLGLTVACARCHDHKFDAVTTADYYSLAGFLQSSRRRSAGLDEGGRIAAAVEEISSQRSALLSAAFTALDPLTIEQIKTLTATDPPSDDPAGATESDGLLRNALEDPRAARPDNPAAPLSVLFHSPQPGLEAIRRWAQELTSAPVSDTEQFADFRRGLPADWYVYGPAFFGLTADHTPRRVIPVSKTQSQSRSQGNNEATETVGELVLRGNHPSPDGLTGLSSDRLAPQLRGSLSSPTFEIRSPEIAVLTRGTGCRIRLVIDGYVMHEFSELLFGGLRRNIDSPDELQWIKLGGDLGRYQGHRAHLEILDDGAGWFQIFDVRFVQPGQTLPPNSAIHPAVERLAKACLAADDDQLEILIKSYSNSPAVRQAVAALTVCSDIERIRHVIPSSRIDAWKTTAQAISQPPLYMAMCDGSGESEQLMIRGNPRNPGERLPRSFLTALDSEEPVDLARGSGRLELTRRVLRPENPFPARVAVNRIWQHLMGTGLVASSDNFGVLGNSPTHPELLDYLASRFRSNGWSRRQLIREIVTSRVYRLSSQASPEARESDPENKLMSHAAVRRLEAEAIRDAILAVSGRLDSKRYGPPVPVYLTPFMQGRGRPGSSGPLDGAGRRSIYQAVRRNFLSPLMLAFDAPAPAGPVSRRTVSNVPAQALILMNNPFVIGQANTWAQRLSDESDGSIAADIAVRQTFETGLGRLPTSEEIALIAYSLTDGTDPSVSLDKDRLRDLCHIVLNHKEFIFLP